MNRFALDSALSNDALVRATSAQQASTGPQGPQGATGPAGPTGAAGPVGPTGPGASQSAFINDGNAFSQAAVLGTTDNNYLDLITNNTVRAQISQNGSVAINSPTLNSTTLTVLNTYATEIGQFISVSGNGLYVQTTSTTSPAITATNTGGGPVLSATSANGACISCLSTSASGPIRQTAFTTDVAAGAVFDQFMFSSNNVIGAILVEEQGNSVNYRATSDRRLKDQIQDLSGGLDFIKTLHPVQFIWKSDTKQTPCHGFIAQELAEVYPNAVTKGGDNPNTHPWMISKDALVPFLVASIQELEKRLAAAEAKIGSK